MELKLDIGGLDEFEKNLTKLGAKIAAPICARALRAAGNILADAQRRCAPELTKKMPGSNSLEPGALKNDIQTMINIDGVKKIGQVTAGPGYATDYVARWLEDGHEMVSHHGGHKKSGKLLDSDKTGKHPFMEQAFEASAQAALDKAIEIIADGINEGLGDGTVSAGAVQAAIGIPTLEPRASSSSSRRPRSVRASKKSVSQAARWQQFVAADKSTRGDWSLWQKG
jgi:HK97 gp10 family phage protein